MHTTKKNDKRGSAGAGKTGKKLSQGKLEAMEAALRESEERYRSIFENAIMGIFQSTPEGRFIRVSPSHAHIHGYDSPEDVVDSIKDISHDLYVNPEDRFEFKRRIEIYGIVENYEVLLYRKDRSLHWVSVNGKAIRDQDGKTLYYEGTMQDITQRKMAEEALREERNRFHMLSENAPFGIALVDSRGNFTYINPKFTDIFGYTLEEVPNGKVWFMKAYPDPDYRKRVIEVWIDDARITKPGEKIPRIFDVTCKDRSVKTINFIPVRLQNGDHIVTFENITEHIQVHKALVKSHKGLESLNRAKTKAVNHISHELKTPLAIVRGNVRLLKNKLKNIPAAADLERLIEPLENNLERLFNLSRETDQIFSVSKNLEAPAIIDDIDFLLARMGVLTEVPQTIRSRLESVKKWMGRYVSADSGRYQSIDLFSFIQPVLATVKDRAAHRNIRFTVRGEDYLFVYIDEGVLSGIVDGLVKNAVENTPDGGTITLRAEKTEEGVWLHVEDYGVGIAEENLQYIFDGLFHTKETDLYSSRRPYDFGAGGKGLELLRMKINGRRYGYDIHCTSQRCTHIPTDRDICPGDISRCRYCNSVEDCKNSGGTIFSVIFPV